MGKMYARALVAAAVLLTATALPANAQITTGAVVGTVTDQQGGVVPGATIVLVSETQGTKTAPVVTNAEGQYVVPNVTADTYTVQVSMTSFRPITRKGVKVSGGDRVAVETLVLQVGGATENVTVQAEAPVIQSATGDRSSGLQTVQLDNLPVSSHNFLEFITTQVGINGARANQDGQRAGGGGQDNVMIDGVSALDTGNNGLMGGMNLPQAAISEVKVLTSGYQAEYGRSSGLQVSAVTRSGTNRFRGAVYDYERNSDWNSNSWANLANGNAKAVSKQRDWSYTIGGPVGKPGGNNKLFFFYTHEYRPRTEGNNVVNYRMPTAEERLGDFSKTLDNNGNGYSLIYDSSLGLPKSACSATDQSACFADGGILGKIPMSRLYGPGIALLNQYPMPNNPQVQGRSYNFSTTIPVQKRLSYTPVVRTDYQASQGLRVTWKFSGASERIVPGYTGQRRAEPAVAELQRDDQQVPAVVQHLGDGELHAEQLDLPRVDLRHQPEPPGHAEHRAELEPQQRRVPVEPGGRDSELHARRPAHALPGRGRGRSEVLRVRRSAGHRHTVLPGRPHPAAATAQLGRHAHREHAADAELPGLAEHQPHSTGGRQRDEGGWRAHVESGAVLRAQLQGAEHGRQRVPGVAQLPGRHEQPARNDVPVRERGPRHLLLVQPGLEVRRRELLLQQHRVVPAGQLEGEPQADARLRSPLRA
jgi:hypothetical protein